MSASNDDRRVYKKGDYVVYRRDGICLISDIRSEDFGGQGIKEYYILEPVYNKNTVLYIPLDSEVLTGHMRSVLSKQDIDSLIEMAELHDDSWIDDTNERYEFFKDIIDNGSRSDILRVLKQLTLHKAEVAKTKRRFYANDDKLLTDAERIITDEFSFVLGIDRKDVIPYIIEKAGDLS